MLDQEIIDRYVRGYATTEERLEVDRWQSESEENARTLSVLRAAYVSALLSDEEFEVCNRMPEVKRHTRPWRAAAYAFSAVAALALVFAFFRNPVRSVFAQEPELVATVTSAPGQRSSYTMKDGTQICLNAGSSVEIYEHRDMRLVRMRGEAFFDVARNEDKPFVVETEHVTVKVFGTRFDVNAYGVNPSVVLVSGSVKVRENGAEEGDWASIAPGQMYTYDCVSGKHEILNVEADNYVSWTGGYLRFSSATLEFVLGQLQNYFSVPIMYKDDISCKVLLSGKLELNGGLDVALGNLSDLVPMKWQKTENNTITLIFNQY